MFQVGDKVVWQNIMFGEVTAVHKSGISGSCLYDISLSPGHTMQNVKESELKLASTYSNEEPKTTIKHGWTKWPM